MIFNPDNAVIFATTTALTITPEGSATINFETLLPADSIRGNYIIAAEGDRKGNIIGKSMTSFQIPFPQAGISLELPPALISHSTATTLFKINNTGLTRIESGSLSASLRAPDNSVIWVSGTSTFGTIPMAGSITQGFKVPLGNLSFGVYQLEYSLSYDGKCLSGKQRITYSPLINCLFDKPSYKARETLKGTLTIINTGNAEIVAEPRMDIDGFGYKETLTKKLIPADSNIDIPLNISIPSTATPGVHKLIVSIGEVNPIINEFDFAIPTAKLEFNLPKLSYQQGDRGTVSIKNTGGVDTTFDYALTIMSQAGILCCEKKSGLSLKVDDMIEQGFQLPDQALEGTYSLEVKCESAYCYLWNEERHGIFNKTISVSGIKPVLNIMTTKQKYTTDEHIFGSITITPRVQDGTLHLKIFKENEAWTAYTGIGEDMKAIGKDGDYIWYGGRSGVARYQKSTGSWTTLTPPDGLKSWEVNSIGVDEDAVWFGHYDGLTKYDKQTGSLKRFTKGNTGVLPTCNVNVIAVDDRYIWFSGNYGYSWTICNCRYDKSNNIWGTWTPPAGELVFEREYAWYKGVPVCRYNTETQILGSKTISVTGKMAVDGDYIWVIDERCKLLKHNITDGTQQEWTFKNQGEYNISLDSISVDKDYVWVGTHDGIRQYDKKTGNWQEIAIPENLGQAIKYQDLFIAADENSLWLTTRIGPIRYDKSTKWETFSMADGLLSNNVNSVAKDAEFIWIATDKGVNKYDERNNKIIKEDTLSGLNVTKINVDNDYVWLSIWNGKYWYEGESYTMGRYDKITGSLTIFPIEIIGTATAKITDILSDDNYVWVGTNYGLIRYDKLNNIWATFTTTNTPFLNNKVTSIAADENYVWVGISTSAVERGGLARYDKTSGTWAIFTLQNSQLPSNKIKSIGIDGDYLWLGTDDGLIQQQFSVNKCDIDVFIHYIHQ
ncbi:hypothetical protein KKE26_03720 [bacterium]|nr:hypothetical protein [bacterium]MBU1753218.1 hypothetical protein [bacterium]